MDCKSKFQSGGLRSFSGRGGCEFTSQWFCGKQNKNEIKVGSVTGGPP